MPMPHHMDKSVREAQNRVGLYGFVACVFLVLMAKLLRRILMRPEDYYDG